MKRIPLTQGKFAIVDDFNYEWLSQWKWHAQKDRNTFYAVRSIGKWPKQKTVLMHRLILDLKSGEQTDHLNGNGLDNRCCNIRTCTYAQNQWNQHLAKPAADVSWDKKGKNFRARITHNGKRLNLGRYKTRKEAVAVYQKARKERQIKYLKGTKQ